MKHIFKTLHKPLLPVVLLLLSAALLLAGILVLSPIGTNPALQVSAATSRDIIQIVDAIQSGATLDDLTWDEINEVCRYGLHRELFDIGDEKTIELTTGEPVTLQIWGKDHDDLSSGSGKAALTFGMKNLLATKYSMNTTDTNVGGWDSTKMRNTTLQTIFSKLPESEQTLIKTVTKKATAGNKSTTIKTSQDKLFLFSEVEIMNNIRFGSMEEGTQYEYWRTIKNGNTDPAAANPDRVKFLANGAGDASDWWMRSPSTASATYFCRFYPTGNAVNGYLASTAFGVCFGFAIGEDEGLEYPGNLQPKPQYNVTYINGKTGDVIETKVLAENTIVPTITPPEAFPTGEEWLFSGIRGYVFSHWEVLSGNSIGTPLAQNTVLRGVYLRQFLVEYRGDTELNVYSLILTEGEIIPAKLPELGNWWGKDVADWQTISGNLVGTPVTQKTELRAVNYRLFRVGFVHGVTGLLIHETQIREGNPVTNFPTNFLGSDFFTHWERSDGKALNEPITNEVGFWARFNKSPNTAPYFITFHDEFDRPIYSVMDFEITVDHYVAASALVPQTLNGLDFAYWEDEQGKSLTPEINSDKKFYPRYSATLYVHLVSLDDGPETTIPVRYGTKLIDIINPQELDWYHLYEWHVTDWYAPITSDMIIYYSATVATYYEIKVISSVDTAVLDTIMHASHFEYSLPDITGYPWHELSRQYLPYFEFSHFEIDGVEFTEPIYLAGNTTLVMIFESTGYLIPINFKLSDEDIYITVISIPWGSTIVASEIPEYLGSVPMFYRFSHWETSDGTILTEELIVKGFLNFSARFVTDYVLDTGKHVPVLSHEANTYNNAEIAKNFTLSGYQEFRDAGKQSRSDPVALTKLQIIDFRYPYAASTSDTYFEVEFGDGILRLRRAANNVVLEFYRDYSYEWRNLLSIPLSEWAEKQTGSRYPNGTGRNDVDVTRWNSFTFTLKADVVDVVWILEWGLAINDNGVTSLLGYQTQDGKIPNTIKATKALPTKDSRTEYYLDVVALRLFPFEGSADMLYQYEERLSMVWPWSPAIHGDRCIYEELYKHFPGLLFDGFYAIYNSYEIELFLEGQQILTVTVPPNSYFKPILPADLERSGERVKWYLDQQMTMPLEQDHVGSMYTALYGRFVPMYHDIYLSFYTLTEREWVAGAIQFYEALTWRTVHREIKAGETISTDRFGATEYGKPFYDRVVGIQFLGWSGGVGQPAAADMAIEGYYKLPQVTVRYFDIDNNLFGDVKQDIELFPLGMLYDQIKLLKLQEGATPPQSDSPDKWPGLIYGFARVVRIVLFGGDDNTFNENAVMRSTQIIQSRAIIERLILEHNDRNQIYFPLTRLDINLENLDKGDYDNANFVVDPVKNPQWRLLNGTPEANNLVYYVDFHDYFSLNSTHNFTLVVNFLKEKQWYDNIFSSISGFFSSLASSFSDLALWIVGGVLLIFCFPLIIALIKALVTIIIAPFRWLAGKVGG